MRLFSLGALALASLGSAQNSTYCTSDSVCYAVNIPASTASSGSGDIYFQISGPSTLSWIGLGQGSSMSGANIFMVYANSLGTNVTLSPRLGTGDKSPSTGSPAGVTLIGGSGIFNGLMVANVKCSNCNNWTGGSMSFTDASSKWIWAYKSGSAISSDNVNVALSLHSKYGTTTLNLQNAAGGSTANPFTAAAASSSTPSSSTGSSTGSSGGSGSEQTDGTKSNSNAILMAHAVISPLAFALFFPVGAMAIRTLSIKNMVWLHAGWMIFTYLIAIAGMGLGIWIAVLTKQLDSFHAIIGLVVVGALLFQPITGLTHHLLFKRSGRANAATYPHIWWGRAVVTLGIINGGFGLQLTKNTNGIEIGYGVGAAIVWCLWMATILAAFIRTRGKRGGETGVKVFEREAEKQETSSIEMMRPSDSPQESPIREYYSESDERNIRPTQRL